MLAGKQSVFRRGNLIAIIYMCGNQNYYRVYVLYFFDQEKNRCDNCTSAAQYTGKWRIRHSKIDACRIDNSGLKTLHNSAVPNGPIDELPLTRQCRIFFVLPSLNEILEIVG